MRVLLTEDDFRKLVSGATIRRDMGAGDIVVIALSDIGFDRMQRALDDAVFEQSILGKQK